MKKRFWYIVGCLSFCLRRRRRMVFPDRRGKRQPRRRIARRDAAIIGKQKLLNVTFSDPGPGLRHTEIVITQDNRPRVLSSIDYPETGVRRKAVSVTVDAAALKLHDGPASLTLTAVDHSLWKNRTVVDAPGHDRFPAAPDLPAQSAEPHQSGRRLRRGLSPVGGGLPDGRPGRRSLLSRLSGHAGRETRLCGLLRPAAGCDAGRPADPHPGARSGRKRDRQRHPRPDPESGNSAATRWSSPTPSRTEDARIPGGHSRCSGERRPWKPSPMSIPSCAPTTLKTIQSVCRKSEPRQLWQDTFLRMKNAAPMALFGDRRTYFYGGKAGGRKPPYRRRSRIPRPCPDRGRQQRHRPFHRRPSESTAIPSSSTTAWAFQPSTPT